MLLIENKFVQFFFISILLYVKYIMKCLYCLSGTNLSFFFQSRHSSTTSILTNDELVIDTAKGLTHPDFNYESDSKDLTRTWNIKCDETSYSRSSTFPLVSGTEKSVSGSAATTTNSSTTSVNEKAFLLSCNPVRVKSYVQIPVAKSSSVPEGSSTRFTDLSRMSLDSFKFSSHVPPVSVVHSSDQYSGTETNTAENVICLRCEEVFPPDKHLKFLDHFPKCQSNRNAKLVSRDGAHRE